jgi:hypothetical protein
LVFAAKMMTTCSTTQQRIKNSNQFENIRKQHAEALSSLHKGRVVSDEEAAKRAAFWTEAERKKVSDRFKGHKEWRGRTGKDALSFGRELSQITKNKIRDAHIGSTWSDTTREKMKDRSEKATKPVPNILGLQILTPTGFMDFDGVSCTDTKPCLELSFSNGKSIIVSKTHRFDSDKLADEYKIGDTIKTIDGNTTVVNVQVKAARRLYDILEVDGGNLYIGNSIVNHNCEMIAVSDLQVVPEATDAKLKEMIYTESPNLGYYPDCYVSLDPGFSDQAAVLFGHYDFLNATIVIQREYVEAGQNTKQIADNIRKIEDELWNGRQPLKRVSDTDLRLIEDLRVLHGIRFQKTEKDNKDAQVNLLRVLVEQGKIKIHESCVQLIAQLKYAQWKVSAAGRRDFKRTPELGHCDAIDALIYFIRNVNRHRNPIPEIPQDPYSYNYNPSSKKLKTKNAKTLFNIFRS